MADRAASLAVGPGLFDGAIIFSSFSWSSAFRCFQSTGCLVSWLRSSSACRSRLSASNCGRAAFAREPLHSLDRFGG
jgi:hypothetical protein